MSEELLARREGAVLTITINRPRVRNAINVAVMNQLRSHIEGCDEDTRVIVITGADGAFCSGAEILPETVENLDADAAARILGDSYHPALKAIHAAPCPVIAAVDGMAAGFGCDLALACDLRIVSERAQFAELFVRVGLIPDGGGTWTLPRLIGMGRALELFYTGTPVAAAEAVRIGMANRIVASTAFEAEVAAFANKLAEQAPHAMRRIRQAVYAAQDMSFQQALEQEARLQGEIFGREDGAEGFRAFLEKRAPRWS